MIPLSDTNTHFHFKFLFQIIGLVMVYVPFLNTNINTNTTTILQFLFQIIFSFLRYKYKFCLQIIFAQLGLVYLSPSSASRRSTGVTASRCTWLTTEVAARRIANSHISRDTKITILWDVPLLDTIYFTVDLNKHKVLVCSPILCLFKLHMCALT